MASSSSSSLSLTAIPPTAPGFAAATSHAAQIPRLFGKRAVIADAAGVFASPSSSSSSSPAPVSPSPSALTPSPLGVEHAYGALLATLQRRNRLADKVSSILSPSAGKKLAPQTAAALQQWLAGRDDLAACDKALEFADQWLARDGAFDADVKAIYEGREGLKKPSLWIVAGDGFASPSGGNGSDVAGVHHALSGGEDINVLVLVTDPSVNGGRAGESPFGAARRDLGLYALNYGGAYVASTAPSLNPLQFEQALKEADAFRGPSVVLALVPPPSVPADGQEDVVASGKWPLYRYDPSKEREVGGEEEGEGAAAADPQSASSSATPAFTADSAKLRADIAAFLDRNAHLSLLSRQEPTLPPSLTASLEGDISARLAAAQSSLQASYEKLMGALQLPPLAIYFGSDGGNAEGIAKRLALEAGKKGFKEVAVKAMDAIPSLDALAAHKLAVFVVSTAGQGEFPMNARGFWKTLSSAAGLSSAAAEASSSSSSSSSSSAAAPSSSKSLLLSSLHFAVFGLGDSNYWPKKEQRIFFNKASADLDVALHALGGARLLERGIGDDQEVGGYQAGFRAWLPLLWTALGVGSPADANTESTRVRGNEDIKKTSNFLRGTILQGLSDTSTGALAYEDTQLTKFHGIYQQDDRDLRAERKRRGQEPAYSFMVRVRIPGGVATAAQYLALDRIADTHANGTVRATTRQAVQFHGILKGKLKPGIAAINRALMDTLAACGDVNRNVMCTANPEEGKLHAAALDFSSRLSAHLSPRTSAYHEIWLDEKLVAGGGEDLEPIYGKEYLPRKFKIGVAVPPSNDVDVYTQDLSFVAIADESDATKLAGFTVLVGGGMGMTHNNPKTYPRLAEAMCYVPLDKAIAVAEAVVTTQRDFGDRTNRKHARLKYTIDDRGLDWFRSEVEARVGFKLEPPRVYKFRDNADRYGWTAMGGEGGAGKLWGYTLFIQNGRIKDDGSYRLKSGLQAIAKLLDEESKALGGGPASAGEFRFTANQNVMLARLPETNGVKGKVEALLAEYGIENKTHTGLRLNAMACVALPTCSLALAESERYLPSLITRLDEAVEAAGLHSDAITVRMTGCPNGCARPFVAEIGFVGRSPGIYNVYLGAGHSGERLNKLWKEGADEEAIVASLSELIKRYALERKGKEEPFGDWVIRAGIVKATVSGRTFHEL